MRLAALGAGGYGLRARVRSSMPKIDKRQLGVIMGGVIAVSVTTGVLMSRNKPAGIPREVAAQPWEEQIVVPGALRMSVPWPLEARVDPHSHQKLTILVGEKSGSALSVTAIAGATNAPLETLAQGGLEGVERAGLKRLSSQTQATTLLGRPALEFSGKFVRGDGEAQVSGVVFTTDTHAVAAALLYPANDAAAPAVWARVKAGFRSSAP